MPTLPLFDLTGRRALITGSSRGIGLAYAYAVAEAGAEVVLNSRKMTDVERAVADLHAAGHRATGYAFDVADPAAVEANVAKIEAEVGPIDILFNNAGIQRRAPLVEFPIETWKELMAINLDAVFYMGQAVAKRMIPRGAGKIINTCSLGSEIARATIAPYTTSKGAVKMLTKAMCVEWAKYGIQTNGIGPGYIRTEMNVALTQNPEFDAFVKRRTPAGRWGEVDELKGVAIFLAAPASDFVNGQIFYVDGGVLSAM
ncbi:MAG TPA: SDR family oxidoreductase [Bauldia sp.]|nr:SDR family oxidoreductase [Bauldia sp.]